MRQTKKKDIIGVSILVLVFSVLMFGSTYLIKNLPIKFNLSGSDFKATFRIGRNLAVPDKYVGLLPVYPGSRIFSIIEGEKEGKQNVVVSTRISETDIAKVIQWHKEEVEKLGYTIDDSSTLNEVTNIWFYNDVYTGSVTLSNKDYAKPGKTEEEIRVSLWLEKK